MAGFLSIVGKTFNNVKFWGKQHAPEILITTSIVAGVSGIVVACVETKKAIPVIEESKKELADLRTCLNNPDKCAPEYTKKEIQKDMSKVYLKTGVDLVKVYKGAIILETISIAGALGGIGILKKRYANTAMALAATIGDFDRYRERLIKKFGDKGEALDKELRYGLTEVEVSEEEIDKNGKKKTVKKKVKVVDTDNVDGYTRVFDCRNPYWDVDDSYNLMFLRARQSQANDRLVAQGYLFLNDVLKDLGFPETRCGQEVGWVYDPDSGATDGYIDFRITEARDSADSRHVVFLLDFNVDGSILNRVDWPDQKETVYEKRMLTKDNLVDVLK